MTSINGSNDACWWHYTCGAVDEQGWDEYLVHIRNFAVATSHAGLLLTIAYRSPGPNAEQRKKLAALLNEYDSKHIVKAHAFVTDSMVARGALTALGWLTPRPFPERVFKNPPAALAWLHSVEPRCDPDEPWQEITAAVPAEALWTEPF